MEEKHVYSPHKNHHARHTFTDYLPLIIAFSLVALFTVIRQYHYGYHLKNGMTDFMAAFFIVFGLAKLLNWRGFAQAYQTYDSIAQKSIVYAMAYPFIELALGFAYLTRWNLTITNIITLVIMLVSSIGVWRAIAKQEDFTCACLGIVFKIPLTYVTLIEDLLMAGMALAMLFM